MCALAVRVDGRRPLSARCRYLQSRCKEVVGSDSIGGNDAGACHIELVAEARDIHSGALIISNGREERVTLRTVGDFADFRNPTAPCALLKCALVCLGLVPSVACTDPLDKRSLKPYLLKFCSGYGKNYPCDKDVILELVSTSLLPRGSGMGTSSILGGCILAAIGACVGRNVAGTKVVDAGGDIVDTIVGKDPDRIVSAVLRLEQLLSSGGGWQDPVGGLVGGLKLGLSQAGIIPPHTTVRILDLPHAASQDLDKRLVLAFTGKPRLARDVLRNVVRGWARRDYRIVETVRQLVADAWRCTDEIGKKGLGSLGDCLLRYRSNKISMAGGRTSGAEPSNITLVIDKLKEDGIINGGVLCGAGGGGFLALLTAAEYNGDARTAVESSQDAELKEAAADFIWYNCSVEQEGLRVEIEETNNHNTRDLSSFCLKWHM